MEETNVCFETASEVMWLVTTSLGLCRLGLAKCCGNLHGLLGRITTGFELPGNDICREKSSEPTL